MTNLDPQAKAYLDMFNQMPLIQSLDAQTVREMFASASSYRGRAGSACEGGGSIDSCCRVLK